MPTGLLRTLSSTLSVSVAPLREFPPPLPPPPAPAPAPQESRQSRGTVGSAPPPQSAMTWAGAALALGLALAGAGAGSADAGRAAPPFAGGLGPAGGRRPPPGLAPASLRAVPESGDPHKLRERAACEERWVSMALDHFGRARGPGGEDAFRQRYFVCDGLWRGRDQDAPGVVFFYTGNEADVELYKNSTGQMYEMGAELGARLVFAEHRYYGQSKPFGESTKDHMQFLSSAQALADYATLLDGRGLGGGAPVVAWGGSYGGMLATWFRQKYPHLVDGALAGSAPIAAFAGLAPRYDEGSFAAVVTRDASPAAGAPDTGCVQNIRSAWAYLFSRTASGDPAALAEVREAFRLCDSAPLGSADDVLLLAQWAQSAFDFLAMGNFPYPSDYLLNGFGTLPAWPMRVACAKASGGGSERPPSGPALLEGLREAVGVFYNSSASAELVCFDYREGVNPATAEDGLFWSYQSCTEMMMPMSRDGQGDMFWPQPWDAGAFAGWCREAWGQVPAAGFGRREYGGKSLAGASNIVFSNGGFDPWSTGGVLPGDVPASSSLETLFLPEGAHHLDFMFSHPDDPPSVREARQNEKAAIAAWAAEGRSKRGSGGAAAA